MFSTTLIFSGRDWLWPVTALAGAALVLLLWNYRAAPIKARWGCAILKLLGFAALLLCLLEPLWSGQRPKPGANLFAIVADNSMGLQIKDGGEVRSRGEVLRSYLDPQGNKWESDLADHFELRRFYFDSRLQATKDFQELNFEGRASAIGSALRGIKERFEGRPLAGILLLTDGNATDIQNKIPALDGVAPIYPVVIGKPGSVRDLNIAQVNVSQTVFEDAPVSAQLDVKANGFNGESVVAQLLDAEGHKIEESTVRARKADDTLAFRFQWRPDKAGLSFYQFKVGLRDELSPSTTATNSREATLINNVKVFPVDRGHGPYRILYVAGRPFWEFKFLNRALQEDDQVQLAALIRIALREPKFDFRGHSGESSNPMFRGFGEQSREESGSYDQPVLERLNTKDDQELRGGFPRTAEDLFCYNAVILDRLEAAFFTPDQLALLQKFVSERGGSLIMLGGGESLREGKYQRTPVGDMLPVYLDGVDAPMPSGNVRVNLTREGWLQAWARLRDNETAEKTRIQEMPNFGVLNPLHDIKPGAIVIATATDDRNREYPALVTQRFGHGRTTVLAMGDWYLWGMKDADSHKDMDKAWRQLARMMVADVPKRVELTVENSSDSSDGAVKLQVRARAPDFKPLDDAEVLIDVRPELLKGTNATAKYITIRAEPSLTEAGLYEASYVPRDTGAYRASVCVTNSVGVEVGRAEAGWSTDLDGEEFRSLQPNVALLEDLARRTGGAMVPAGKLAEFARNLPQHSAPVMEAWTMPAWHTPALFAFALACLVAEWGLRRWKGMP